MIMKAKYILILSTVALLVSACAKDDSLGVIEDLTPDYVLPQGKSPDDNRIVEFYAQYGTYILYEFTRADFDWSQVQGTVSDYVYSAADPLYAGKMLDLLYDVWFDFYPEEFNKKYLPYKIFLTSTMGIASGTSVQFQDIRLMSTQIALTHCSDTLDRFSAESKLEFKNNLQCALWEYWGTIFDIPEDFYSVSDYSSAASDDPASENYARARGFVAYRGEEWCLVLYPWVSDELDSQTDLFSFLTAMICRSTSDWVEDLEYPLVKKKYDILRNHFLDKYGVDLQKIGDVSY